jgi:hypothetical protein
MPSTTTIFLDGFHLDEKERLLMILRKLTRWCQNLRNIKWKRVWKRRGTLQKLMKRQRPEKMKIGNRLMAVGMGQKYHIQEVDQGKLYRVQELTSWMFYEDQHLYHILMWSRWGEILRYIKYHDKVINSFPYPQCFNWLLLLVPCVIHELWGQLMTLIYIYYK